MILYPAIDLKDGQCVRLRLGDMARATVFNDDPAAQALAFQVQGFSHLHVVDLDGAFAGQPRNAQAVERILAAVTVPVQLGGGIRDMGTLEGWLAKGVARAIIGTAHAVPIPVIASGGLASIADVRRLLEPDCAVLHGAITGRALYDGRLDPAEALAAIRDQGSP